MWSFVNRAIVSEAPLESTDAGLVAAGDGWFVLGAREGRWRPLDGLGARLSVEGDTDFPQVGINRYLLGPGEPIGMYHWEATQVWGAYSVDEVAQRHGPASIVRAATPTWGTPTCRLASGRAITRAGSMADGRVRLRSAGTRTLSGFGDELRRSDSISRADSLQTSTPCLRAGRVPKPRDT
jgi:hypothetical protein